MKKLFTIAMQKPALYETSKDNIWSDPHTVKRMLKAHLDTTEDSATRRIETVEKAIDWISRQFPAERYPTLLDLGCGPGVYTERFCKKRDMQSPVWIFPSIRLPMQCILPDSSSFPYTICVLIIHSCT